MSSKKTGQYGKDWNEFYRIHTPIPTPLPFGGFWRLAAKCECVKCGRDFIQVIRVHKVQLGSFLSETVIHKANPNDEKIMTTFMLRACENGVGCWKNCRPFKHMKVCGHHGECNCPRAAECVCPKGCGNRGIHPCQCGRMFDKDHGKHRRGCPVGLYKRTSSFEVSFLRSQMVGGR